MDFKTETQAQRDLIHYLTLSVSVQEHGQRLSLAYLKHRNQDGREKVKLARIRLEGFLYGVMVSSGIDMDSDRAAKLSREVTWYYLAGGQTQ